MSNLDPLKPKVREHTGILNSKKEKLSPQSFRLTPDDVALLVSLMHKVNALSKKKFKKTHIVQGLIHAGIKIDAKLIYKGIKDSM